MAVTGHLMRPTRGRHGPRLWPLYLVLLRVGFALPHRLPGARCALTAPFHPYRDGPGGIFSAALSIGSHRPEVIWHPALWSPDFPRRPEDMATGRRDYPADFPPG